MSKPKDSKIKFIPWLLALLSVPFIIVFYTTDKIEVLQARVESLHREITELLPKQTSLITNYIAKYPQSAGDQAELLKQDIEALNRIQLDKILQDQDHMDKFEKAYNLYQKHFAQWWQLIKKNSKPSIQEAEQVALAEQSKETFFKVHALSLLIQNYNESVANGGDFYINYLFTSKEKFPDLKVEYFPKF